ncbi:MAG TPA: hypothetical protein VLM85_31835, partial [Polyangiaceae bacterium]|nr:hypothetical protein [Polyangiaceae bacterium]
MAINRHGAVLLLLTTTGFGASLALIWPRSHPPQGPTPPAPSAARDGASDAKITPNTKAHGALCKELATRYRAAVETAAIGCSRDDDCLAQERGGVFLELDGCGR